MALRTSEALARGADVVVQDVPLLFENKLEALFPTVVLVWVPPQVQVERLVSGRGFSLDRARQVIAAQMPIDEKRDRASHVIDNSGSREATRAQVAKWWETFRGA